MKIITETGEVFEEYTHKLIGKLVTITDKTGKRTEAVTERYCSHCDGHMIGTISACGGFLAQHKYLHDDDSQIAIIGT